MLYFLLTAVPRPRKGKKTMPEESRFRGGAAPKSILASTALVALALAMGLLATPAEATGITSAGQTGPGIIVTPVNQVVTLTDPVTFGPYGGFTASIDATNNLVLTANEFNQVYDVNFTTAGGSTDQLNGLSLGDTIGGTAAFQGTEYDTAGLAGNTVYYGLETFQSNVAFNLDTFMAENQGWVEISYAPLTVVKFALDPVPEPSSLSLFAVAVAAMLRRRKRKQSVAV